MPTLLNDTPTGNKPNQTVTNNTAATTARPRPTFPHVETEADRAQQQKYLQMIGAGVSPTEAAKSCGFGCGGAGAGGIPAVGNIGVPTVTPAPEYKKSPEQLAWEEMYSGQLEKWIESGGYGIPEETQTQMIQRTTDALKAKEAEDIRVMRNNMERRGLTNSGFVFSNEQKIRANTTMAIANSITDIQIQSALLKMASFERALGAAGEYLGYLSQESQLAYQPKLATWSAQQQANLVAYQAQVQAKLAQYAAQVEMQKMQIAQAYEQQNMRLAAQLSSQADYQQFQWEKELTQMKIDANEKIAMYQGKGQLVGFGLGALL